MSSRHACIVMSTHKAYYGVRKKSDGDKMQASGKVLLIQRVKVSRGEIHVIKDRCKQCRLCIELCPKEVLQESEEVNEKGYHLPEVVEEPETGKICVACGFCEVACPEFAIWVEEKALMEGDLWEK